jgi:hypothetical protein
MHRRLHIAVTSAALALLVVQAAPASESMLVGAAEDAAKSQSLVAAKASMDLAKLAGFNAIRLTETWSPGQSSPSADDLQALNNAAAAAQLDGIRVIVSVYPVGGRSVPLTPAARATFAEFAAAIARSNPLLQDFIVGNEPNLNRFWMPQYTPKRGDAAAPAYEAMLATTYDALKAVSSSIRVIGGAVSPHGEDRPRSIRPTHSPTTFIRNLGRAYRKSGRAKPIMDAFAFHPYNTSSRIAPTARHPRSTTVALADYEKLVRLLGSAFARTAQRGARLPIFYDEFGIQSRIPFEKESFYSGFDAPGASDAVPEDVQARYYRQALTLAACQPTVAGFLFFHVVDESDLGRWQSGIYYADATPKTSFAPVKVAIDELAAGRLGRCGVPHGRSKPKHG